MKSSRSPFIIKKPIILILLKNDTFNMRTTPTEIIIRILDLLSLRER